jgi:hypothetical protein
MGYANIENQKYWDAISLAANLNGDEIEVRNVSSGLLSLTWTGAAASDAVVKLQQSVDKTTWHDITGMTKTIGAASGSYAFEMKRDLLLGCYVRAVLTKNSETTGTATIKAFFKGER